MATFGSTRRSPAPITRCKVGGDVAVLKGMMKRWSRRDDAAIWPPAAPACSTGLSSPTHTTGFEPLPPISRPPTWDDIEAHSGLSRAEHRARRPTVYCQGQGGDRLLRHGHHAAPTRHANVQQIVNLLLLRGNIGRPGAGICPVRGHSNVQGDRTVGITEKPTPAFLDRIGERLRLRAAARARARRGRGDRGDGGRSLEGLHRPRRQFRRRRARHRSDRSRPCAGWTSRSRSPPSSTAAISSTGKTALILPCLGRTRDRHAGRRPAVDHGRRFDVDGACVDGHEQARGREISSRRSPSSPASRKRRCRPISASIGME